MTKRSVGILMYRRSPELEVLLVHPGGPFWANKDDGAWSIPKGEYDEAEEKLACAVREFEEELGARPEGAFIDLGEIAQPSRKIVAASPSKVRSIPLRSSRIGSRSNGHRKADGCSPSQKSIARHGSRPVSPRSKFCQDNKALSTGYWLRSTSLGSER